MGARAWRHRKESQWHTSGWCWCKPRHHRPVEEPCTCGEHADLHCPRHGDLCANLP